MTRLLKGKVEWEGLVFDQFSIVEGEETKAWPPDAVFTAIGKPRSRIDGPARVTGRAVYTNDLQLQGMLYARVLRSPHPHARIRHIDVKKALAHPGVRAVVSSEDVPDTFSLDSVKIFDRVVRYVGDEVAAVAADDDDIAGDALSLIDVDYEPLPFVLDAEEALKPGAPPVQESGNISGGNARTYQRGDVSRGFAEADAIVESTFYTQSAQHNCMEPHGVVASWDGDELNIWESTQSINRVQGELAAVFNLPLNKVRVSCEYMGGGFGSKQYTGKWSVIAALLALQAGTARAIDADPPGGDCLCRPSRSYCSAS